jgi:hypothetical protein
MARILVQASFFQRLHRLAIGSVGACSMPDDETCRFSVANNKPADSPRKNG